MDGTEKKLKALNYDLTDIEQIKVIIKFGSSDQSIQKEYILRKPNSEKLDWAFFQNKLFYEQRDNELSLPIKKEDPIIWVAFMKDKQGSFHMYFDSPNSFGHDLGIKSQNFEDYAKAKLKHWSIKYTKQLDANGDFIPN